MKAKIPTENKINEKDKKRFLSKIQKTDACWIWIGTIKPNGYGQFGLNYKIHYAHRFAYKLFIGEITKDLCVLHKCDNRRCVNPNHLFLGTLKDNVEDCIKKGRNKLPPILRGENHGSSKLKLSDVVAIRRMYQQKEYTMVFLGKLFGVKKSQISKIINKKLWRTT